MSLTLFYPVLPEILLLLLGLLVLVVDLVLPREKHRILGWVTAVGMGFVILLSLVARPGEQGKLAWGGMISYDWLSFTFKMLFIFGAGITALLAMDFKELGNRGEFYLLMIASTIGMAFMASATDLIMLYLAIETVSIPLYILAGFFILDKKSTESGFKYLLFGAMTSAIMLYGFSLLYGLSGTTNMLNIVTALMHGPRQGLAPAYVGSLVLVLVGLGFKISAVPFHFWAPDVYEGAPTPVAGFLSTASKAAGFAVLLRLLLFVFPQEIWAPILAALSVVTMTLGNLVALTQHNIKRMLAYSSIAHAGYALIGVVAVSSLGLVSVVYYLFAYLITNLAAFGIVSAYGKVANSDEMTAYYGMSRRSPGLALALLVALLSLAGMPPLAGFIAKFFVFLAAVQSTRWIWLAVVGVLNSIVGLYYYLTVLKYVYLYRSDEDEKPVPVTRSFKVALAILIAGILLVGTVFTPFFNWASTAAATMF
jgi:NADH-quinone oxidoreductase subunit N